MKNIRKELGSWAHVVSVVVLWIFAALLVHRSVVLDGETLHALPEVVFVYSIVCFVFTEWCWRWRVFQGWLVPCPDLEGTWEGTLVTTWQDPQTGMSPPPIRAYLVIKQSFDALSCTLYTKESGSSSNTAGLKRDEKSDICTISYNYTNSPRASIRHRSEMHNGAAVLTVTTKPQLALQGEYWTGRKTTGEMHFTYQQRKRITGFPADEQAEM